MAKKLKCWKKVTENKIFTTYQKQPDEDNFITVTKQNYDPIAWGYKKKTDFRIGIGNHHTKHTKKNFKTKTQALKFANSYMKKHDTCKI